MRTRHGWCVQPFADVSCHGPMRVGHGWCRPAEARRPRLMHVGLGWCCVPLADVVCQMRTHHGFSCRPWPMSPVVGRFVQAMTFDVQSMHTRHGLCVQALADSLCRLPTSFARCAHATSDACKPSLMPPAVGNVACMTPTCHVRYVAQLEILVPLRGFWLKGVGIVFPENHNKHVQPKYARSKVQIHINFHK